MITRHDAVEGSGNFDHLIFLKVHGHRAVHGSLAFRLHQNATAATGVEPAAFGLAAECHNHCTTEAEMRICGGVAHKLTKPFS